MRKVLLLSLCALFAACSSGTQIQKETPQGQASREKTGTVRHIPAEEAVRITPKEWLSRLPAHTEFSKYAMGSGPTMQAAEEDARANMAAFYKSYVEQQSSSQISELTTGQRAFYKEYYQRSTSLYTRLNLPGVTIIDQAQSGGQYYALAKMDIQSLKAYQADIEMAIHSYLNQAAGELQPVQKMNQLLMAASLLIKTVYPVSYEGNPVFLHIYNALSKELEKISFKADFSIDKKEGAWQSLTIHGESAGKPLSGLRLRIDGNAYVSNSEGKWVMPRGDYPRESPFTLSLAFDLVNFPYPDLLEAPEIVHARTLIQPLAGQAWSLTVTPPFIPRIYIESEIRSDQNLNAEPLTNGLKAAFSSAGYKVVAQKAQANVIVNAQADVKYSSTTILGACYMSTGTVHLKIKGKTQSIGFTGQAMEEETKSFHDARQRAAEMSLNQWIEQIQQALIPKVHDLGLLE
jgi:hypothetical protein